jgi:Animal haem peroxidase
MAEMPQETATGESAPPPPIADVVGMAVSGAGPAVEAVRLHGEVPIRGGARVPLSPISEGRFGRMFRRLPSMPPLDDGALQALAEQMREPGQPGGWEGTVQNFDNETIPAGYTYLGQFIDHDITFDPTSSLQRRNDPDALHDFRTPRFDLDSLYGSGPIDEPFQYRRGRNGLAMLIEPNINGVEDLPRNSEGVALIGDPRNDENTIVGQLQLVFLALHDKLAAEVEVDASVPADQRFAEAERRLRWHYQWAVVHDYLPKVIGTEMFNRLYNADKKTGLPDVDLRYYRVKNNPYMPVEFSVAAFRFGHSQIRGIYNLSQAVRDRPIFTSGPLADQFADLRGFRPLPPGWTVDWSMFFPIGGSKPQPSRMIDAKLVPALFDLPDGGGSLAFRNLKRAQALGLPSGQDVAKLLQLPLLTSAELAGAPEPTPLWFYILKESEVRVEGGRHLGPVGGRIVGEVLLGLLRGDPQSWFSADPAWTPTISDADGDGVVGVPDLIQFALS